MTSAEGELLDRFSTCGDEMVSGDGYRLLWFQSTRKAALDAATRNRRLQQASAALAELQERLSGPRTRFRQRGQVEQAVARILEEQEVAAWLAVCVEERPRETFRQATPGRPTERTRYVKQTRPAYALSWEPSHKNTAKTRAPKRPHPSSSVGTRPELGSAHHRITIRPVTEDGHKDRCR